MRSYYSLQSWRGNEDDSSPLRSALPLYESRVGLSRQFFLARGWLSGVGQGQKWCFDSQGAIHFRIDASLELIQGVRLLVLPLDMRDTPFYR